MRFVCYDDGQLGLLTDDGTGVIDLTDRLGLESEEPLVERIQGNCDAREYEGSEPDHKRSQTGEKSKTPGLRVVPWPTCRIT